MPESQNGSDAPAPEVLQPQDDTVVAPQANEATTVPTGGKAPDSKPLDKKGRRLTYRPSHKATFIGIAVVLVVLAINAGVVFFFIQGQSGNDSQTQREQVTISTEELEKLGVNKSAVGNLGTELIVGPDSRFNGRVVVASDVDIAGQLTLNNSVSAAAANLTKLQAGDTSVDQLNVNGDGTISNLALRGNLAVAGTTELQGAITVSNNMNVIGNLTVGGSLFAGSFQANNLVSGSTLTLGGHVVSKSAAPSVSAGGAVGSNGTVSISGTDVAGTVAVNAGTGAGNGVLASIDFRTDYTNTPKVVVTAVGRNAGDIYVNRSASGFTIVSANALSPGGYAFDYIIIE